MKVKTITTQRFTNLSLYSTFNFSLQKYLLHRPQTKIFSSSNLKKLKPCVQVFVYNKKLTKLSKKINDGSNNLHVLNFKKMYDITNTHFFDTHHEWYTKFVFMIGQSVPEFAADIKPLELMTPSNELIQSEEFNIQSIYKKHNLPPTSKLKTTNGAKST